MAYYIVHQVNICELSQRVKLKQTLMEKLSYSLWAIIVCLFYSIIFIKLYSNANKDEQLKIKDVKFFGYAIFMFFLAAMLNYIVDTFLDSSYSILYKNGLQSPEGSETTSIYSYIYYGIRTIISAANNIFLVLAIPFIQLENKGYHTQNLIVKYIDERLLIYFLVLIEIGTILIGGFIAFSNGISPLYILIFDSFISIIVIGVLAWFINTVFRIRTFKYFQWISWITFLLMFITQVLQYLPNDYLGIPSELNGAISSAYKTLLIGLILILMYTYQDKEKIKIKESHVSLIPSSDIFLDIFIESKNKKGLNALVDFKINPLGSTRIDFSKSRVPTLVLLKFMHRKKLGTGSLKVQTKGMPNASYDFKYIDLERVCKKIVGEESWLLGSLKNSLFEKDKTNCYSLSLLPENIVIHCDDELLENLLGESRSGS